ncbi:Pumilio-like 9 [Hondaea fermentalgiana]|uniref:Pumilio-like 9 n=1 Tax=Hondaea fermentalgiana TaxID=2315210 RepID=A0A2R5G9H4_9STRA|nr:Pumilio-like 9 [Hondaea fermentalgiana]|eukprot:GBG27680.1 Pumilio-like 9 [Hondaea fermentalgiana]
MLEPGSASGASSGNASVPSSQTRRSDKAPTSGGSVAKTLEDDIDDLRLKLVSRQRKMRTQEEDLLTSSKKTKSRSGDFDVDAELRRLEGKYRTPNEPVGNLDVDELLDLVTNRQPLHALTGAGAGAGTGSNAAGQSAPGSRSVSPARGGEGLTEYSSGAPGYSGTSSEIFLPAARREEIVASIRTVAGSQAVQRDLDSLTSLRVRDSEYDNLMHRALEVFVSAQGQLGRLLMHRTANYAVSKLFEVLDARDRLEFLKEIKNRLSRIAQHPQGTFALQKIISALHDPEHLKIVQEGLRFEVRSLALDRHATFTLQKLLSSPLRGDLKNFSLALLLLHTEPRGTQESLVEQITQEDIDYFRQACLNKHGAMLLTAFIRNCPETCFGLLVHIMKPNLVDAACDQYGNYVVQKALERACTSEHYASAAFIITEALCFPDQTLLRVATDSFGVKVFLTALSQSASVRDKITERIFPVTADPQTQMGQILLALMSNPEASTLLKRAIRLQQDADVRARHVQLIWDLLPACQPLINAPEYERWVHFLERT